MFDDSLIRAAYLPRTNPPGKSERLYSARSSFFLRGLAFFINLSFGPGSETRTDDANGVAFLGVRNREEATLLRHADRDPPGLAFRVVRVGARYGQRIRKRC